MNKQQVVPCFVLRGNFDPVTCVKFLSTQEDSSYVYIISGTQKGQVFMWSSKTHRVVSEISAHNNSILDIIVMDNKNCLTHGRDGKIHHWKINGVHWQIIGTFQCGSLGFCSVTEYKNIHKSLITYPGHEDSSLQVAYLDGDNENFILTPATNVKFGMCMHMKSCEINNKLVTIIAYESGHLAFANLLEKKIMDYLKIFDDPVICFDYHDNNNRGFAASVTDKIISFRIDECDHFIKSQEIEITNPGINCLKIRQDCKIFATGGSDFRIRIFSVKSLKQLAVLCFHSGSINKLTFNHDNLLAVCSNDTNISIWKIFS